MKTHLIFTIMLVMAIFVITDANAVDDSQILPKDQPNFDPIISSEIIDGKTVEIVEFNCKLAK
ncbi:MAG: hypothetical protein HOO66_00680 [Nitrosarchaeum sp.]|nr:hypothetical protein [Nitrosarchaeum sp.]